MKKDLARNGVFFMYLGLNVWYFLRKKSGEIILVCFIEQWLS